MMDGPDIAARVAKATFNAKLRLAIDTFAGESTASLSSCLALGGTVVLYSFTSGKPGFANGIDLVFHSEECQSRAGGAPARPSSREEAVVAAGLRVEPVEKSYRPCRFRGPTFDVTVEPRLHARSKPPGDPAPKRKTQTHSRGITMRFIMMVKTAENSGPPPTELV
jgi:hypothetical protein